MLIVTLCKLNVFRVFGVKLFVLRQKFCNKTYFVLVVTDVSTVLLKGGGHSPKKWECMCARFTKPLLLLRP